MLPRDLHISPTMTTPTSPTSQTSHNAGGEKNLTMRHNIEAFWSLSAQITGC